MLQNKVTLGDAKVLERLKWRVSGGMFLVWPGLCFSEVCNDNNILITLFYTML